MHNKAPIKRNKNLVWLSRDHHDGLLVVWKIRQGIRLHVSGVRIKNFIVSAFANELEPHFNEEETLLFTLLENNDALRLKAELEHAAIRDMKVTFEPANEATYIRLEAFANLLEAHIRFEERILFPHIEKSVLPEELDSTGRKLESTHIARQAFVWPDVFWAQTA